MARTSRRGKINNAEQEHPVAPVKIGETKLRTALYARLSAEQEDGDTLQSQVDLLTEYVAGRNDLEIYDVYTDNGYSGTNFKRPAFQQMMMEIQTGQIQCVVVKDFSRFGRNFIETGYYIETLLPKLNVRLISVNDRYDSDEESSRSNITVPVKNMVNEFYARDISKKICVSNEARRKRGNYSIEKSIYGYRKDKENNAFVVDPETAQIVQLVFRWFLDGVKCSEIAKRLNAFDFATPKEYKYRNEFHIELEEKEYWNAGKVQSILRQQAYTGDRCLGQRRNRLYKNQQKQEWMSRDSWTIYKDDHEPLVVRAEFEEAGRRVREQKEAFHRARARSIDSGNTYDALFSSLIYCKKCGFVLHHHSMKHPNGELKPEGELYSCRGRGEIENRRGCGLTVKEGYIQAVVAKQIKQLIKMVVDMDQLERTMAARAESASPVQRARNKIRNLSWQLEKNEAITEQLYKDLTEGLIDQEEYSELRRKYRMEKSELASQIQEAKRLLAEHEEQAMRIHEMAINLAPHVENMTVTRELVEQLIEKIEVDEDYNVEIIFKCQDIFERALDEIKGGDDR